MTNGSNRCERTGVISYGLRRFPVGPNESATHAFPVSEARFQCHSFDGQPALLEQQLRRFQSQRLVSLSRRRAGLGSKYAPELPWAEACDTRKIFDFERYSKVSFGVSQNRLNPIGFSIKIQQCRMLRLTTRPSMVHH